MRTFMKRNLIELSKSILEVHDQIKTGVETELRIEYLSLCQDSMIAIAELVEQEADSYDELEALMQSYCDRLYQFAQEDTLELEAILQLDQLVMQVQEEIGNIKDTYKIVFLPYKAEMWDALHSVWEAFKEDERCECAIVPIPYYAYNAQDDTWVAKYDGERFAKGLPIVHYCDYSLEEMAPDLTFIHNPYDENNAVTRVHPNYFSYNLKKYVGKLAYIPYYAASNKTGEALAWLYKSMDYIILQSDGMKELHKGLPCYDKILALGSPKVDSVIQKCNGEIQIRKEWKRQLDGKTVILLNTSIHSLLRYEECVWMKLLELFELIRSRDEVTLIWRPHPLLENTIESMRPALKKGYRKALEYFRNHKIGILDTTSELEDTISYCDAYIGDASSSVTLLFGVVGKPLFFLDYLKKPATLTKTRSATLRTMERIGDTYYATTDYYNGLFVLSNDYSELTYVTQIDESLALGTTHGCATAYGNHLYLAPSNNKHALRYDCAKKQIEEVPSNNEVFSCIRVLSYQDKIIYLPKDGGIIRIYHAEQGKWSKIATCIMQLRKAATSPIFEDCVHYDLLGADLWICAAYTNVVAKINLETEECEQYVVGEQGMSYSAIRVLDELIWLAEMSSGHLISWNHKASDYEVYELQHQIECWENANAQGRCIIWRDLFYVKDSLVMVPNYSNQMMKFDLDTKEITPFLPEVLRIEEDTIRRCQSVKETAVPFAKQIDDEVILLRYSYSDALIEVNSRTGECKEIYPHVEAESYEKLCGDMVADPLGFEQRMGVGAFSKTEGRLFTIAEFLDDLVSGRLDQIKKKQMEWAAEVVMNLDGTCGAKVYEYMMGVLTDR